MASQRKRRQARRSAEEWAVLLAEQASSGLSQTAFCTSRGLTLPSFANAKRRLRAADGVADGSRRGDEFVALDIDADPAPPSATRWDIELSLGAQVVLRIRSV